MTDREALYRAILENPDDDTLRLIYADALEEEGKSRRAAFIRTEIALARVPDYDPAWIRARCVEREERAEGWPIDELPPQFPGLRWSREPFRRGFPGAVEAEDPGAFVAHADELFAAAPVESLDLSVASLHQAGAFAEAPWRHRLVRMSVGQGLGAQTADALFGSNSYERLRDLTIGAGLSTTRTASSVMRSRVFSQLTALSWWADLVVGRMVDELASMPHPPRLARLRITSNRLGPSHLGALLAAPVLATVEDLDLSESSLAAEGLQAIAASSLPHLRSLHLDRARVDPEGLRALAASPLMAGLRALSLGGNVLHANAAVVLADSAPISGLSVLKLHEMRLGDAGVRALAASPHLSNLALLDLSDNSITDAGAQALLASPHLNGLIYLNLSGNGVSPALHERLRERFGPGVA